MRNSIINGALLLTVSAIATNAEAQTAPAAADDNSEIIVTASKRSERLIDVPTAVAAFKGADLLDKGLTRLQDYLTLIPGVQLNQNGGSGAPVIRGLTSGLDTGALVGLVIDGAPIGASSTIANGGAASLDLDPIDLERVEVLKGPQGTLYGANAIGGLISYTLARPDLSQVKAIARGELSGTQHGGTNYSLRAAASAPLIQDRLAVRLSGYVDRPNGFVDNSVAGLNNQNRQRNWGVSGSLLFAPTPELTIKLDGFYQRVNRGLDTVIYADDGKPRDGDLRYNDYLYPQFSKRLRAGIGTIDYDLGGAKLTSITSYQDIDTRIEQNQTQSPLGAILPLLPAFGGVTVPAPGAFSAGNKTNIKKVTEELRLSSTGDGPIQYVAGLFYTDEDVQSATDITGHFADRSIVPTLDPALLFNLVPTYKEFAGFANLTYKFSDSFDLTGGIRVGRIRQTYRQIFSGSDAAAYNVLAVAFGSSGTPADTGIARGAKTVINYLATARYHFSPDGMIYARFATGFRPGGPNVAVLGLPRTYNPDQTENYELGLKSKFMGGRGMVELTGFYMNWKDFLVNVGAGGVSGLANGGRARLYGAEGTVTLTPATGFNLVATLAYNSAKITEVDPLAIASVGDGDRLPHNPRWSGSVSAGYRTSAWGDWTLALDATARFVGERHAYLASSTLLKDWIMPSYALVDLRAGLESRHVGIDLFVRNLTDKRAQLSAQTSNGINEITIQRPRTIGAAVTFKY